MYQSSGNRTTFVCNARNTRVRNDDGTFTLMTSKRAAEVEEYRRRERAEAKLHAEAEARRAEFDALLKFTCQNPPRGLDSRMDVYAKTMRNVWILSYRGGDEYSNALLAVKFMWSDKGKWLHAMKLLTSLKVDISSLQVWDI